MAGEAYALLQREGPLVSRVGRGTYVARPREGGGALVDLVPNRLAPPPSAPSTCRSASPGAQRPGADQPVGRPADRRPRGDRGDRRELEAVVREEGARLFRYGPPRGDPALRELVAAAWRRRGLDADPERILVTTSGQQAIDLAVRALVEPGDTVLCETPTYAGAIDSLVAARARIVPCRRTRAACSWSAWRRRWRRSGPRALFVNPTGNNATGTVLPLERRAPLAALAPRRGS